MPDASLPLLLALGLTLGLRHGVDWDHIAAITDVTSTQPSRLRAFLMGTLYALGHAFVVVLLGLLALWASTILPEWVDIYMERVVGVTLVALGAYVFWSLLRNPREFRLRSRWMLVFSGLRSLYRWVVARLTGTRLVAGGQEAYSYGALTSWTIGMVHGIGAETGSQALLLASVAGATTTLTASLLLLTFVVGLVLSNSAITVASSLGFVGTQARRTASLGLGVLVGLFSLVVGALFLLGRGDILPDLLA